MASVCAYTMRTPCSTLIDGVLTKGGFLQSQFRMAPMAVASQSFKTAEERNHALIEGSFFRKRLNQEFQR